MDIEMDGWIFTSKCTNAIQTLQVQVGNTKACLIKPCWPLEINLDQTRL